MIHLAAASATNDKTAIREARLLLDEVAREAGMDPTWNAVLAAEVLIEDGRVEEASEVLEEALPGTSGALAKKISRLKSRVREQLRARQGRFDV